jgi:drug/metabolite transporter (DMT)-like permease
MHFLGPICAFASSVTWALGSNGYAYLTKRYSAFSVNLTRTFFALPLFIILSFILAGGWEGWIASFREIGASHIGWYSLSMFASYGFGDALFYWSAQYLPISSALAIASCYPLWTTLIGKLFLNEQLPIYKELGVVVTVGGLLVVILNGKDKTAVTQTQKFSIWGVMLAFGASIMWMLNSFSVAQGTRGISVLTGNVVRMSIGFIFCTVLTLLYSKNQGRRLLPVKEIKSWSWLFILEGFGGSLLFTYGLSHSPLAVGTALAALAPVIAPPVAWILGYEKPSLWRTLGVVLVVLGVCLLVS